MEVHVTEPSVRGAFNNVKFRGTEDKKIHFQNGPFLFIYTTKYQEMTKTFP